jgi:hypothetical protein
MKTPHRRVVRLLEDSYDIRYGGGDKMALAKPGCFLRNDCYEGDYSSR